MAMDPLLGHVRDVMPPMERERDPPWDRPEHPFLYDEQTTRASSAQFSPRGPPRAVAGISAAYVFTGTTFLGEKFCLFEVSPGGEAGYRYRLVPGLVSDGVFAWAVGVHRGGNVHRAL